MLIHDYMLALLIMQWFGYMGFLWTAEWVRVNA